MVGRVMSLQSPVMKKDKSSIYQVVVAYHLIIVRGVVGSVRDYVIRRYDF